MDEPAGPDRPPIQERGSGSSAAQARPVPEAPPAPAPFVERRATPDNRRVRPPTPRVALILVAAVVLAIVLYQGRQALSPFVVGLLLVYLLDPPVERISRLGVPRWIAVLIVYVLVAVLLAWAIRVTTTPLIEQMRAFVADLPSLLAGIDAFYRSLELPPALRQAINEVLAGLSQGDGIDLGIFTPVLDLTAGFISGIFGYLIIPVWAFYLLKDRPQLTDGFNRTLPEGWRHDVWEVIRTVERVFGQWVRGQLFLGVVVGVATFIGLEILNVAVDPIFGRFALLLAVIAGLLELLPIIGPIIAAVPAVLLAATAGPQAALAALLLYLLVQQIENNILVPKIQGDAVELHPSIVMFALVIGGAIGGLLGAILALPITAAGRSVFRYLFHRLSEGEGPEAATGEAVVAEAEAAAPSRTAADA
jgi:predicted PurR-regulated permease PerM